jgi:hypothetical protein
MIVMPDPDATRVAQIRARWAVGYYQLRPEEVESLLAALAAAEHRLANQAEAVKVLDALVDAQAARLAALEAALATAQLRIGELFDLRAAAEQERAVYRQHIQRWIDVATYDAPGWREPMVALARGLLDRT